MRQTQTHGLTKHPAGIRLELAIYHHDGEDLQALFPFTNTVQTKAKDDRCLAIHFTGESSSHHEFYQASNAVDLWLSDLLDISLSGGIGGRYGIPASFGRGSIEIREFIFRRNL